MKTQTTTSDSAIRKRRFRERRRAEGFKAFEIWAYPEDYPAIKRYIDKKCSERQAKTN